MWQPLPFIQGLEQMVELACSVPGCGEVSVKGIMEVVNNRPGTVQAVMDAKIKDDKAEVVVEGTVQLIAKNYNEGAE